MAVATKPVCSTPLPAGSPNSMLTLNCRACARGPRQCTAVGHRETRAGGPAGVVGAWRESRGHCAANASAGGALASIRRAPRIRQATVEAHGRARWSGQPGGPVQSFYVHQRVSPNLQPPRPPRPLQTEDLCLQLDLQVSDRGRAPPPLSPPPPAPPAASLSSRQGAIHCLRFARRAHLAI